MKRRQLDEEEGEEGKEGELGEDREKGIKDVGGKER